MNNKVNSEKLHVFIFNPFAGNGKNFLIAKELINEYVSNNPVNYVFETTKGPGDATKIAFNYALRYTSNCRIISVGGDGTLNETLNGIVGTCAELGVIPCGSGNDFIKSLSDKSVELSYDLIERTLRGSIKMIDVASVNNRYFLNIASVGFDADVVCNSIKYKKIPIIPSRFAYIISLLLSLIKMKSYHVIIDVDGVKIDKQITLAAIANGKYYGGGITPAPDAIIDDGVLDLCVVDKISRLKVLAFFPKYRKGTHGSLKEVSLIKCKEITVKCTEEISINIDGELSKAKVAYFKLLDKHIGVLIP
jgi:YegS/Rv2252/BmrU family lipid kinase